MLTNVTADNASNYDFTLSDGTVVQFVGITSKNNIKVRLPATHYLSDEDAVRIFFRNGEHYKDDTDGITLSATLRSANDIDGGDLIVKDGAVYRLVLVGKLAA